MLLNLNELSIELFHASGNVPVDIIPSKQLLYKMLDLLTFYEKDTTSCPGVLDFLKNYYYKKYNQIILP